MLGLERGRAGIAALRRDAHHHKQRLALHLRPARTTALSYAGAMMRRTGRTQPPQGRGFIAISNGDGYTCALRANGSPLCWGDFPDDLMSPPDGETFTHISSGSIHACALRADSSPVCWGDDSMGRASPPQGEAFTAISSGGWHTCALREDGSPVCWGDEADRQTQPPAGEKLTAISQRQQPHLRPPRRRLTRMLGAGTKKARHRRPRTSCGRGHTRAR